MLNNLNLENILFLDIETVPQSPVFEDVPEYVRELWEKKSSFFRQSDESASDVYEKAGIHAEFGKIICISAGFFTFQENNRKFKIKSFFGDEEKSILNDFIAMLEKFTRRSEANLCAHNGKEFDFPYLARRMIINNLDLPRILDIAGKKPWEMQFLDTMELWKFGSFKHYTSLDLLSHVLGLPNPKNEMDGSQVSFIYYVENDLKKIVQYCENDVLTVAQIILKFKKMKILETSEVEIVTVY